jgi:hypothetical protein
MTDRIRRYLIDDYTRDYYAGALMLLLGLGALTQGMTYNVGSLTQMGPGFFPVALGTILALLGIAIAGTARRESSTATEKLPAEWRGWICILLSIVAFVVLGKYGGLLPATFAIVFISALGDRQNTISKALVLASATSAVCIVIFWWALQLRFPLFTWG